MALTAPADCFADARLIIRGEGLSCNRVVAVDYDSILYLNSIDHARTMWLHRPERGKLRLQLVPGFDASPPEGWHDLRPGDKLA